MTKKDPWGNGPVPIFVDGQVALDRIDKLVSRARAVWLAMMGFLAFATLTLFSVRDIDFFSIDATTTLPIVGIAIPTIHFFWTASLLAAALHTYFHLMLLKLWDIIAEAPPYIEGMPLGDRVLPWLVADWALRRRPDRPVTQRPLDWLSSAFIFTFIWLATPVVLFWFWWGSMVARDWRVTLPIAIALAVSIYVSIEGWQRAKRRLSYPGRIQSNPKRFEVRWVTLLVMPIAMILILSASSLGTGVNSEFWIHSLSKAGFSIDPVDYLRKAQLDEAQLAVRPADWRDFDVAKEDFRRSWCREHDLSALACEPSQKEAYKTARRKQCVTLELNEEACSAHFSNLDQRFEDAWTITRDAYLANIKSTDLRGRDLRQASMFRAFLPGIRADGARLEGANLRRARLEGADLSGARLEGADLSGATLEGAYLFLARFEGANLFGARLEGADLGGARLDGAYLGGARLDGAYLGGARLEGADLSEARLEGANLWGARLEGADLSGARLEGADLSGARLEGADLSGARLEGAKLQFATLEDAFLEEAKLEWTNLLGASFNRADLRGASLVGAYIAEATLEEANLRFARLDGVNLSDANLKRANLWDATLVAADLRRTEFKSADWDEANMRFSLVHWADFTSSSNLVQNQLSTVIGNDHTILPEDAAGRQLHVWPCWNDNQTSQAIRIWGASEEFDLIGPKEERIEVFRDAGFICPEGTKPQPVGQTEYGVLVREMNVAP